MQRLSNLVENKAITINELPLIFVRVRNPKQMVKICTKFKKYLTVITGFIWPKFDMINGEKYVEEFEKIIKNEDTNLYAMPLIESKSIMFRQSRMDSLLQIRDIIEPISKNIIGVRGGAADFCNIFGLRRDIEHTIWDIKVVSECLADIINVFSRDYVVAGPVWEYFGNDINEKWAEGLRRELKLDYLNGMIGKICIHPSQLPIVQEQLIVSYENYRDALKIIDMNNESVGVEKGYGTGKMNEVKTHTNWAKKIIQLANIYGVKKDEK